MTGDHPLRRCRAGMQVALLTTVTTVVISGCTSSPEDHSATRPRSPAVRTEVVDEIVPGPTRAQCTAQPKPAPGAGGMQEIGGTGLYGLLFTEYPIQKRTEAKIAWRVAGSGPTDIIAEGPGGRALKPLWGPEAHTGSNWDRPGTEWGTGFRFPSAGCWQVVVDTDDGVETAAVRVV
jgi:hypothetical protein